MWYFTWILGLGAALAFGIINVMWLEASFSFGELDEERVKRRFGDSAPPDDAVTEQRPQRSQG
jgi:cyd operon protein YbgT